MNLTSHRVRNIWRRVSWTNWTQRVWTNSFKSAHVSVRRSCQNAICGASECLVRIRQRHMFTTLAIRSAPPVNPTVCSSSTSGISAHVSASIDLCVSLWPVSDWSWIPRTSAANWLNWLSSRKHSGISRPVVEDAAIRACRCIQFF